MAEIPRDLGALARQIGDFEITSSSDVRRLTDLLRAMLMDVAALLTVAAAELLDALRHLDDGKRSRASRVARPIRIAATLAELAARRAHTAHRTYLHQFDDVINPPKQRATQRRFDPTK
jgi:hypothetical protein